MPRVKTRRRSLSLTLAALVSGAVSAAPTNKPDLHARHWLAITGKPLAASAGAQIFTRRGNAVDAACAMLAATSTMWDTLGWGGETQALIYHPGEEKVVGVNGLGVAPTGATVEFFREKGMLYPPEFGPLAAVTPGTPGALMTMLAEYGTMSLAEVLAPAIEMAEGYPIEAQQADNMERRREILAQWPSSRAVFLPHWQECAEESEDGVPAADCRVAPEPGEIFRQPDLHRTLSRLVAAEADALADGSSREEAIHVAYDLFYRGEIAREIVEATREAGGLFTLDDLDRWQVYLEEPVFTTYKGIEVYKLTHWVQGPVMLQLLNLLEPLDLKAMGYNSAGYIHTLYQAMNLAFADRDFYYGDPYFPPEEPIEGLLSKDYAKARLEQLDSERNDPDAKPGDPYPFQGEENPFSELLAIWSNIPPSTDAEGEAAWQQTSTMARDEAFVAGTTSIQAADAEGWVVSITPSGAWIPAFIAGDTGVGLSQRMQSFVLDERMNPYNVLEPGKRPRATLTPGMALKDGKPYLSFAVQGGDTQDQNLLQWFLNVVEWGMTAQEAAEAANFWSYQMQSSFGAHTAEPGRLRIRGDVPVWVEERLEEMSYDVERRRKTSGPITAIVFDHQTGTMWGAASDFGEDYGVGW